MKRENKDLQLPDIESLAQDEHLISQIDESYADQSNGRVYNEEQGLAYLRRRANGDGVMKRRQDV